MITNNNLVVSVVLQDCLGQVALRVSVAQEESKVSEDHKETSDHRDQLDRLVLTVTLEQPDHLAYQDRPEHLETL